MGFGKGREGRGAYTFRKCLSLPYEYDIALDEICIERLEGREQEIAMSRASSVNIQIQPKCAGNKRLGGKGRSHAHDQPDPHDRLRLLELDFPPIQPREHSDPYARPAQREPHVRV